MLNLLVNIVANMDGPETEYSDEDLQSAIQQELQMKNMLDQSIADLNETVAELQRKYQRIDSEGNEWKTRYDTQHEMNCQLERQMELLKDKIQLHNGQSKRENLVVRNLEEMSDSGLKGLAKRMEKEKLSLEGQLRDMEWRIDQESKALHKATEGRKKCITELMEASFHLSSYERLQGKRTGARLPPGRAFQQKSLNRTGKEAKQGTRYNS